MRHFFYCSCILISPLLFFGSLQAEPRSCAAYSADSRILNHQSEAEAVDLWSDIINSVSIEESRGHAMAGSCLVGIEKVLRGLQQNPFFYIDVRSEQDYQQYNVPGSINAPIYKLKVMSALKGKKIILLDEGYNSYALQDECSVLEQAGFSDVSILTGGLSAWRYAKNDWGAVRHYNKLPAQKYLSLKGKRYWLVVDVSQKPGDKAGSLHIVSIPFNLGASKFNQMLENAMMRFESEHHLSPLILMVSANGERYDAVRLKVKPFHVQNVWYLEGGADSYMKASKKSKLISRQHDFSNKKPAKCEGF